MKRIFEIIKNNPLFAGIGFGEFESVFKCLSIKTADYQRDEVILLSGDTVNYVGVILSGSVQIIKEDIDGRITILTELGVSGLFAEVFACAGIIHSPVTVLAAESTEILFMDYKKIISSCSSACLYHTRLIENMLKLIAHKNLILNQKIEILSKRTTRDKLLAFFDTQRGVESKFSIPYNREELANFLCVDRSALSKELCKMRDEGLIAFSKNTFELQYCSKM